MNQFVVVKSDEVGLRFQEFQNVEDLMEWLIRRKFYQSTIRHVANWAENSTLGEYESFGSSRYAIVRIA